MRSKAIVAAAAIAGLMREAFAATSHAAVSIRKPDVSLQARAAVKVSAFPPRAHLDNLVTEARIPQ